MFSSTFSGTQLFSSTFPQLFLALNFLLQDIAIKAIFSSNKSTFFCKTALSAEHILRWGWGWVSGVGRLKPLFSLRYHYFSNTIS